MVRKGDTINTDFELDIVQGGEEKRVRFSELLDRPAIVSVYMRNNTPGCDKQNRSLAESASWFDQKGYNLIALSKDRCGSHQNYARKFGINYILASDPEYRFAEATDSLTRKKMFGKSFTAPSRSAYVIDRDGTVLDVIPKIDTKNHAEELKGLVEQLK